MLNVTVIGHSSLVDEAVAVLQHEGALEVVKQSFDLPSAEVNEEDARLRDIDEFIADAAYVREFLGRYHTADAPFSAFISEKIHLSEAEYLALKPDNEFARLYRECEAIADTLAHGQRESSRLKALVAELQPWRDFQLQIREWRGTEHVVLFTGTVPSSRGAAIRQALRDQVSEVTIEELGPVGTRAAWVVMAHRCCVDQVRAALALTDFKEVSFPGLDDYPAEESARSLARIEELDAEAEEQTARARVLSAENYHHAVAHLEALHSARDALVVREEFGATERAFFISGWVVADERERLERAMEALGTDLDISFAEPAEDDNPPVELDNPRLLKPFEVLTDLYGRPAYREVDPTPLLAPFFVLFFGICMSDVGYGLMIIVGAHLIKTRLDVAPGVKKFMSLLMLGGVSAMIVGVLFGSYFAIPFELLPPFLQSLRVLDPLAQLTEFLVICLALGVTQVFFGVLVSAFEAFRRGDPATAIAEPLSTIFFFSMIAVAVVVPGAARWALVLGLGITMLLQGRAIRVAFGSSDVKAWDRGLGVGWLVVTVASMVALAFTGDLGAVWAFLVVSVLGMLLARTVRRSVLALLGGAYAVYGMSAFIGDILSYTRLAALGLSGALVGWVFNILTGLVWSSSQGLFAQGGAAVALGVLVVAGAIALFVFGHTFNVVINLLGAFVHPARLQFVEFFSKFYEGGGKVFSPFKYRSKNLVFSAGEARREGGAES
jgi:V/A-type H+-transporting ATPase subunit I